MRFTTGSRVSSPSSGRSGCLSVQLVGSGREHEAETLWREVATEERDERTRGRVGPVQILDDEEDGVMCAELVENAHERIEQP